MNFFSELRSLRLEPKADATVATMAEILLLNKLTDNNTGWAKRTSQISNIGQIKTIKDREI